MTNYDAFRNQRIADKTADNKIASSFVLKGNLATTIAYKEEDISAAIAYVNQEELDKVYVFTEEDQPLNVGDIFVWSDLHFIVVDYYKIVKDVLYNKYLAFECNFAVDDVWGWFRGPMKTYVRTQIQKDTVITSQATPLAILPHKTLSVGEKFLVGDRPWIVIEADDNSTAGLSYYSLEATIMPEPSKPEPELEPTPEPEPEGPTIIKVNALDTVVLTTENGYFECDKNLKVIRTLTEVRFTVPFGLRQITVKIKKDDVVETIIYEVE